MQRKLSRLSACTIFAAWMLSSNIAFSQGVLITVQNVEPVLLPRPPIIIVPGPRPHPLPQPASSYKIKQLEVNAKLDGQIAKVQVSQIVREHRQPGDGSQLCVSAAV